MRKLMSLFIILGLVLVGLSGCGSNDNKNMTMNQKKAIAWNETVNDVKENLKSPSSAKFPLSDYTVERITRKKIKVEGYVDSQNESGAMIRTYFTSRVLFDENNDFEVTNLKFK